MNDYIWDGLLLTLELFIWHMSFICIKIGENGRILNGRGAGPVGEGILSVEWC